MVIDRSYLIGVFILIVPVGVSVCSCRASCLLPILHFSKSIDMSIYPSPSTRESTHTRNSIYTCVHLLSYVIVHFPTDNQRRDTNTTSEKYQRLSRVSTKGSTTGMRDDSRPPRGEATSHTQRTWDKESERTRNAAVTGSGSSDSDNGPGSARSVRLRQGN